MPIPERCTKAQPLPLQYSECQRSTREHRECQTRQLLQGKLPRASINGISFLSGELLHGHWALEWVGLVQVHNEYGKLDAAADPDFFEDPEKVVFHRMLADIQASSDLAIALPGRHQNCNVQLSLGKVQPGT